MEKSSIIVTCPHCKKEVPGKWGHCSVCKRPALITLPHDCGRGFVTASSTFITDMSARVEGMNPEDLTHIVKGVLTDYTAWLTTREERLTLSKYDDAAPACAAMEKFMNERELDPKVETFFEWPSRCIRVTSEEGE